MRLYRLGATGNPVRDIQYRLLALGHSCEADELGEFGDATAAEVIAFQKERGLAPDGIVGPDTWRALYEAGYRLGDRLLFLRRPMLRGEDVLELQSRLNNLGFDSGKPDGIFGPDTERGLTGFQRDRGLSADGVAGPEVITELRLVTRGPMRAGREAVREREWLRSLPRTLIGTKVSFDAAARSPEEAGKTWETANGAALELAERGGLPIISRSADERLPERVRARRANRGGADLIISFQMAEPGNDGVYYFASAVSRSEAGARLAQAVANTVGGKIEGRATAILRETRAPAVVVSRSDLGESIGRKTIEGLDRFFRLGSGEEPPVEPLQIVE